MDKSVLNKKTYRNVENYTSFLSIIPLKMPFPITLSVFHKSVSSSLSGVGWDHILTSTLRALGLLPIIMLI